MNIRNVLRTYTLLRQLTDDESALLTTLRGLSDGDREQLVESLAPAKGAKKVVKKARTKSPHAASLSTAIKRAVAADRPGAVTCAFPVNGANPCGAVEDDAIHDLTYSSSHPFVPPAQAAGTSSSRGTTGTGSIVSSETEQGDASSAAHGGD